MGGDNSPKRAFGGLRWAGKLPILAVMENFSTPRRTLVPAAANLLTLLVLVCTTWWSSHYRAEPVSAPPAFATGSTTQTVYSAERPATPQRSRDDGVDAQAATTATMVSTSIDREAVRTVGYMANPRR